MLRDIKTLPDANVAIREIQDDIRGLTANVVDFKQRRISNAAKSVAPNDYVTREELLIIQSDYLERINKLSATVTFLERRVKALEP